MTAHRLFVLAFALVAAAVSDAQDSLPVCSTQVSRVLASPMYAECQRDVAVYMERDALSTWIFSLSNKDAIHGSEACMTTLLKLERELTTDACVISVPDPAAERVTVKKAELSQVAAPCRRRRLRPVTTKSRTVVQ